MHSIIWRHFELDAQHREGFNVARYSFSTGLGLQIANLFIVLC